MHLLHLDASARRDSFSRRLGGFFVEQWRDAYPEGTYAYRDLVADPVPAVDEDRVRLATQSSVNGVRDIDAMEAVVAQDPSLAGAWAVTAPLIRQLLAADVLLLCTPMYNYSVPAQLKAWIDLVTLPWLPLAGKRAVVLSARGGAYGPGTPREGFDFQETYLRAYFGSLGLTDLEFVHAELTHAGVMPFLAQFREQHEASYAAARDSARRLAAAQPVGTVEA